VCFILFLFLCNGYHIVHLVKQHVEKLIAAIGEVRDCWLDHSERLIEKMDEVHARNTWKDVFVVARTVGLIRQQFAPMMHLHGKLIDQTFKTRQFRGMF
jgi:hypothetical protein